jgi:hypothetical protein
MGAATDLDAVHQPGGRTMPRTKRTVEPIATAEKLDEARVREALSAAGDERRGEFPFPRPKEQSFRGLELGIRRRNSEKRSAAAPGCAGTALEQIEEIRVRGAEELHRLLQQTKAHAIRNSAETGRVVRADAGKWRDYTGRLASLGKGASAHFNFNFVVLDTPALILPSQCIDLAKAAPAPWNNVGKFTATWSSPYPDDGSDTLSYVFAWRNPNNYDAVINVASYLMFNGCCDAGAGQWSHCALSLASSLRLFEWWNNPASEPPAQSSQWNNALFLTADGGDDTSLGEVQYASASGNYDVSYNMFMVPPQSVAVFTVSAYMYHFVLGDGWIEADFASGALETMCPALVIAILN